MAEKLPLAVQAEIKATIQKCTKIDNVDDICNYVETVLLSDFVETTTNQYIGENQDRKLEVIKITVFMAFEQTFTNKLEQDSPEETRAVNVFKRDLMREVQKDGQI